MISAVSTARRMVLATSTSAWISPVRARRAASASACLRPSGDRPPQVRTPPMRRSTVDTDSPWRIRTSRVMARRGYRAGVTAAVRAVADHASFSTNPSSWRRLRHSYTPSVCTPYSPTIESPVFQYDRGSGLSQ